METAADSNEMNAIRARAHFGWALSPRHEIVSDARQLVAMLDALAKELSKVKQEHRDG